MAVKNKVEKTFWFSVIYSYVSKTLHLQQFKRKQSSKLGMWTRRPLANRRYTKEVPFTKGKGQPRPQGAFPWQLEVEKRPGEEVGQRVGSRHGASTSPFVFCWLFLPESRGGLDSHMKAGVRGRWLSPIRGVNFRVDGFFWTKREFVWPLNPLAPPPHCFCLLTSLRAASTIWTPETGYPSDWLPEQAKWSGWRVACVASLSMPVRL